VKPWCHFAQVVSCLDGSKNQNKKWSKPIRFFFFFSFFFFSFFLFFFFLFHTGNKKQT